MPNAKEIKNYLSEIKRYFSEGKISAEITDNFVSYVTDTGILSDSALHNDFSDLFTLYRDKKILPSFTNTASFESMEKMTELFRRTGIRLIPSEQVSRMIEAVEASYSGNDVYWRFYLLRAILMLRTFQGGDFLPEFLRRLSLLPSFMCFKSMKEVDVFGNLIRGLFKTPEQFMDTYSAAAFGNDFFDRDITLRKCALIWIAEISWNIIYKEHSAHERLFPQMVSLMERSMARGDDETVMYLHFPLSQMYLNLTQNQAQFKTFNEKVEMPLSKYISDNMIKWNLEPCKRANKGKKLAFAYDRLVGNSPVKLLVSLLNHLKNSGYDLYVYDMAYIEKAVSDPEYIAEVKSAGATYVSNHDLIDDKDKGHYYSHLNKCLRLRERIIADEIDILISVSNRIQTSFLFSSRTAPLQIYWSHGNHEYDVLGTDRRICHFDDGYRNNFEFHRFQLTMLDKYLAPDDEANRQKAMAIKKTLPEHDIIFGSIGRLLKLSDEYLATVAELLKRHKNAIYLACGDGPRDEIEPKVIKLGIADRFIFTGWVDPHVYGHVIDIYLNTFPLVGGESVNEFRAKGANKYVVSL